MENMLLSPIVKQAENFLIEFDEFYPFAYAVNSLNEIKSIGVYLDNEMPTSEEVLSFLTIVIKEGILKGEYIYAAICLDVLVTPPYLNNKMDSLEIKIIDLKETKIYYLPYRKTEKNKIDFLEMYS
ncbi:MAG: hypothetical protein H7331_02810 [Bacteroidia bacterium]|nr:hypothetical protein [Bacteroidia bacterium]